MGVVMANKPRRRRVVAAPAVKPVPNASKSWDLLYYKRDDRVGTRPGRIYLDGLSPRVRSLLVAIIKAVVDAPPPAYSGGGKWEVLSGRMAHYYQAKADGFESGQRLHYRLFCLLERPTASNGLPGPCLIILDGMTKPYLTEFTDAEYDQIQAMGIDCLSRLPRSVGL
jgi:hypothetical protein